MTGGLEDRAVMSKDWYKNRLSPGLKFDLTNMWEGNTPHPRLRGLGKLGAAPEDCWTKLDI
jgi:hypothetical protein